MARRSNRARVIRNSGGVRRILQSQGMRTACERAAGDIAGQVRARGSRTYASGFSGLVRVEGTDRAGVRGDRAGAAVIVDPPSEVKFPDVDRFATVSEVARAVTSR